VRPQRHGRATLYFSSKWVIPVTDEERFIDLEVKLTRQEDLTQELNEDVYRQQKQIDELQALCKMLMGRLNDASGGADAYVHEKPPHY